MMSKAKNIHGLTTRQMQVLEYLNDVEGGEAGVTDITLAVCGAGIDPGNVRGCLVALYSGRFIYRDGHRWGLAARGVRVMEEMAV